MVLCAHVTAAEQLARHSWFKKLRCLILALVADGASTATKAASGLKLFLQLCIKYILVLCPLGCCK